MKAHRFLIVAVATLSLAVLLPGFTPSSASHDTKLALRLFPTNMTSSVPFTAATVDRTVVLTVQVTDITGKQVSQAHVDVYQANRRFSGIIVRPADYQAETDVNGIARFPNIIVKTGESLGLSIEVSREDMKTERIDLDLGTTFPTRLPLQRFTLEPRPTGEIGGDFVKVGVNVQNDSFDFVEGASVLIRGSAPSERYQGITGPEGGVIIPVAFTLKKVYLIEVSKGGYKPNRKTIELDKTQVGTTVFAGNIVIEKLSGATDVIVTVTDQETHKGISDAEVILDGPGYYTQTTNGAGIATLTVAEIGSFSVRISQDYYEPFAGGQVRILQGETSKAVGFSLKAKPKKDAAGDEIEVTVLAKDPTDENSKPQPLKGASVSDGRGSVSTDGSGQATLKGAYDGTQEVTVTADGFKTQTKRVGINKLLHYSKGSGSATFILVPELSDSSPIRLIVEVIDSNGGHIKGADVDFYTTTGRLLYGRPTDAKGECDFKSGDSTDVPLSVLRQGLTVAVKRTGYKNARESVSADLLKPSTEARRYVVQLDSSGCNGFAGTWKTSFGTMTFTVTGGTKVTSSYDFDGGSIKGQLSADGKVLEGTYTETKAAGRFRFSLNADLKSFSGNWNRTSGTREPSSGNWEGKCVQQ